ncbi:Thiolase-like protein [Rhypophila sp. PSN 637]
MFSTHWTIYQGIRAVSRTLSFTSVNYDQEIDMEEYHRDHSGVGEDFLIVPQLPRDPSPVPIPGSNLKQVVTFDTPPATPPPSRIHSVSSLPALIEPPTKYHYQDVPNGNLMYQKQLPPLPTAFSVPQANIHVTISSTQIPQVSAVVTIIATGVPPTSRSQAEVASQVAELYGPSSPFYSKIPKLYANTRISTRHKAVDPLDPSFDRAMPIRQRMDLFLSHAEPLCVDVARRAASSPTSGIATPKEDIGLLVVVTSTGFVAPGVDVAIVKGLGLSRGVKRVVVNFMGCAAAMNGIRTAADYAISQQYQSLGKIFSIGPSILADQRSSKSH